MPFSPIYPITPTPVPEQYPDYGRGYSNNVQVAPQSNGPTSTGLMAMIGGLLGANKMQGGYQTVPVDPNDPSKGTKQVYTPQVAVNPKLDAVFNSGRASNYAAENNQGIGTEQLQTQQQMQKMMEDQSLAQANEKGIVANNPQTMQTTPAFDSMVGVTDPQLVANTTQGAKNIGQVLSAPQTVPAMVASNAAILNKPAVENQAASIVTTPANTVSTWQQGGTGQRINQAGPTESSSSLNKAFQYVMGPDGQIHSVPTTNASQSSFGGAVMPTDPSIVNAVVNGVATNPTLVSDISGKQPAPPSGTGGYSPAPAAPVSSPSAVNLHPSMLPTGAGYITGKTLRGTANAGGNIAQAAMLARGQLSPLLKYLPTKQLLNQAGPAWSGFVNGISQ